MSDEDGRPPAADVRAVLREHGHPVPERGRLAPEHYDLYDAIREQGPGGATYDGGVTEADFPAGAAEPPSPERKPRRVRTTPPPLRERVSRLRGAGKGKSKSGRSKPKYPRVPVDRLVGLFWEGAGRMFAPISPATSRCLQLQAPVAGLVLEDTIKDTFVDRALQPVARSQEKAEKLFAVAAPPMIVLALERAQLLPDDQRMMREAILVPMLREALVLWDKVAGDKLEEQMARNESEGPARERAERIMAQIFAPPPGAGGPGMSPEDEAAARAQQMAGAGAAA